MNVHRLQHRLQGSLIPFAPYAFAVQRQFHWVFSSQPWSSIPSSPLEFRLRSSHFTSPEVIPYTSLTLEWPCYFDVLYPLFDSFPPSQSDHRLPALYTESLWTTLASVVWPRLLAQSLDETTPSLTSFSSWSSDLYNRCCLRSLASLVQAFAHWPRFSTAAFHWSLVRFQHQWGGTVFQHRYLSSAWLAFT